MKKQTLILVGAAVVVLAVIAIVVGGAIARSVRRNNLAELIRQAQQEAAAQRATEPGPTPTPNAAEMESMLAGDSFPYKLSTARLLAGRKDIPVKERVRLLATALAAEVESPSDSATVKDSYLAGGQVLRLILVRGLSELGAKALPDVRLAAEGAEGITREHLLVALAYMGDKDALPEVRLLVTGSSDPAVRMDAARALGIVKDKQAVPVLVEALRDDFEVNARNSLHEYSAYPVREQAAGALDLLGIKVTRSTAGSFTVEGQ